MLKMIIYGGEERKMGHIGCADDLCMIVFSISRDEELLLNFERSLHEFDIEVATTIHTSKDTKQNSLNGSLLVISDHF